MCSHNLFIESEKNFKTVTHDMIIFDWEDTFLYLALNMFCYQAISTFYTVRNSMREPKNMMALIPRVFGFVLILVILMCVSFYTVTFPNSNPIKKISFTAMKI